MRKMLIFMLCLVGADLFGQGMEYGQELRVNSNSDANQWCLVGAPLKRGGFVMCWASDKTEESESGVFGQIFNVTGEKSGSEFRVNSTSGAPQMSNLIVISLSGGGFFVCWSRVVDNWGNGDIFGQIFDEFGNTVGGELYVNTYTQNDQCFPAAAPLPDGGFAVCWQSFGQTGWSDYHIFAQMFDKTGKKIGKEFKVDTWFPGSDPDIASLSANGFIICWAGTDANIYGQVFDSSGKKKGVEFMINTYTGGMQIDPHVSSLANGFIVCWEGFGQISSGPNIFAQTYDEYGVKSGDEFQVNADEKGDLSRPRIASLPNGGAIITWEKTYWAAYYESTQGQLIDSSGKKKQKEFFIVKQEPYTEISITSLYKEAFFLTWASFPLNQTHWSIWCKFIRNEPIKHELTPFALNNPSNDATVKSGLVGFEWNEATREIKCYPWEVVYDL
jgi:hypothetical protein